MPPAKPRQRRRGAGRPFQPGHDPRRNLGGRPRGLAERVRERVESADGEDRHLVIDLFERVARGEEVGGQVPKISEMLEAAKWLADRGYGKPMTPVELGAPEGQALSIVIDLGTGQGGGGA